MKNTSELFDQQCPALDSGELQACSTFSSSLLNPAPWCPWEVVLRQGTAGAAFSVRQGEPEAEDHNKADRGCFLIKKVCIPSITQTVEWSNDPLIKTTVSHSPVDEAVSL